MKAIVLAAGKGKRLQSEKYCIPKVLREVCGKPMLQYVLQNISFIPAKDICIVAGYMKEKVMNTAGESYTFAVQEQQLGTGHAVKATYDLLKDYEGDILVLYGDMPLFKEQTYRDIIKKHIETGAHCTILTAVVENPPDYGRIIRNDSGAVIDIIEKKDCTPEQLKIKELNVGIYVFKSKELFQCLECLRNNNSQGEYYLTDVPKVMLEKGLKVSSYTISSAYEIIGVNTPEDLALCEKVIKGLVI